MERLNVVAKACVVLLGSALIQTTCVDASPVAAELTGRKVVSMPFSRRHDARDLEVIKREVGAISVSLGNAQRGTRGIGIYYVKMTAGTPPQTLQLQLDTGSSDLWMFSKQSCESEDINCLGGIFDPSKSSTYKLKYRNEFNISYVTEGSGVHGDYIIDNVSVGDEIKVKGLTMGLAKRVLNVPTGIMGIGYRENEAIYAQTKGKVSYPNLVDLMVDQDIINTRAYSLYLDNKDQAEGTILFGGYDSNKFAGELQMVDIQPDENGEITSFIVAWTSFSITTAEDQQLSLTTDGFAEAVYLDSGTTLTVLPEDIAMQIIDAADAFLDPTSGVYLVACSKGLANATLNYQFGGPSGPIIHVPFSELVLPIRNSKGEFVNLNGETYCLFGIKPAGKNDILLFGDTFLRSAYVVYDLDGKQIGLAQAIWEMKQSKIVEIDRPVAKMLGVESVKDQPTAQATATSRNAGILETQAATDVQKPTETSNSAGFTIGASKSGATEPPSTETTTSSESPNAAGLPTPAFGRAALAVVLGSMGMMLVGGGVFTLI